MTLIADWMKSHAVDMNLAKEIGLRGDNNTLSAPYKRADGTFFVRTRKFPDGNWIQPAGEPLACWWPLGRAQGASVLICEGEGDTLAAASILDKTDHPSLNGLAVVGLPGVAAVKVCAAELALARTPLAYICLDADEGGHRATEKLQELLPQVGVIPFPIWLATDDLATCLYEWSLETDEREEWLGYLVSDATPQPIERPPKTFSAPLTDDESELKNIPAPVWISRLAGIEQPEPGTHIRCPLHDERTPSCLVHEDYFICFGCQAGGDIFCFAMALWDCDFRTAKERLLLEFSEAGSTPLPNQSSLSNV